MLPIEEEDKQGSGNPGDHHQQENGGQRGIRTDEPGKPQQGTRGPKYVVGNTGQRCVEAGDTGGTDLGGEESAVCQQHAENRGLTDVAQQHGQAGGKANFPAFGVFGENSRKNGYCADGHMGCQIGNPAQRVEAEHRESGQIQGLSDRAMQTENRENGPEHSQQRDGYQTILGQPEGGAFQPGIDPKKELTERENASVTV